MLIKDFVLPDQQDKQRRLSDYKGKWIVLYFYPRDNTPGCTKEACSFRDQLEQFKRQGVVILGVSKDSVASHAKFSAKYRLSFPILSDEDKRVIKAYRAWGRKKFMGREFSGIIRKTYLIDPDFTIRKVYPKVNPLIHAREILDDVQAFQ